MPEYVNVEKIGPAHRVQDKDRSNAEYFIDTVVEPSGVPGEYSFMYRWRTNDGTESIQKGLADELGEPKDVYPTQGGGHKNYMLDYDTEGISNVKIMQYDDRAWNQVAVQTSEYDSGEFAGLVNATGGIPVNDRSVEETTRDIGEKIYDEVL